MSCDAAIRAFNGQAHRYNQLACVQRRIAEQFFSMLAIEEVKGGLLLDVGCGSGFLTERIKQRYPDNTLVALDAAPDMLGCVPKCDRMQLLCADFNAIPLADNSCNAVFSNVALQWSREIKQTLSEWLRVLKPGGRLYFSTLVAGTLIEWDKCWQLWCDERRVNVLSSKQQLNAMALPHNAVWLQQNQQTFVEYHPSVQAALASVRDIGASQRLQPLEKSGLLGKKKWQCFLSAYEQMRTDSGFPLTYEVYYGAIEKK